MRAPQRGGTMTAPERAATPALRSRSGTHMEAYRVEEIGMNAKSEFRDVGVALSGHVATVEIRRPPNNYFDNALIGELAAALDGLDADPQCRAVVLAAEGKAF